MGSMRMDIWAAYRILANQSYRARFSYLPAPKVVHRKSHEIEMPRIINPVPFEWETIEAEFTLFWVSQVTHASFNTYQSPLSKLHDGVFQVMVIR